MTAQHATPLRYEASGPPCPDSEAAADELAVEVSDDGQFTPADHEYARQQIRAAVGLQSTPIVRAAVRLVRYLDPALQRPVVARATLDVNGRLIRTQATAASARQSLDDLRRELAKILDQLTARAPAAGATAPATTCTVEAAIAALDALGRPFHLFRDVDTGEDTVVYRAGPTGYRLAQTRHRPLRRRPPIPLSIAIEPAPRLATDAAADRLIRRELPFLFFADPATGRGAVAYLQRNGHVRLVTLP